ncbi:MAG: transcription termination/antitermination NusG family protein [Candidatus Acidiferrales bacterium]
MNFDADCQRWFALQVRTRWESSTAVLLSGKGYQTLLPTYKARKRWNGRLREVSAPLFPGYVFCQFDAQKRLPILITPGVLAVVGRGRVPLAVDDSEIAAIQTIVSSGFRAEPWPYLEVGQKIRIESDSLMGLEGILINFKGNHRIVVSVTLLRRAVALEIDGSCVKPVATGRESAFRPVAHPLLQGV